MLRQNMACVLHVHINATLQHELLLCLPQFLKNTYTHFAVHAYLTHNAHITQAMILIFR